MFLVTFWQINQQEMPAVAEKPRRKIRFVSKCTAASRGPPCDSTARLLFSVKFCVKGVFWVVYEMFFFLASDNQIISSVSSVA